MHLGECPRITDILGTLNKIARFSPDADRNREEVIIDNLFIYPKGEGRRPKSDIHSVPDSMEVHHDGLL